MSDLDSRSGGDAVPAPGDRLDSWKEIAAFLRRDVRTVQRWEKQAGLPVHRHAESRLRTAYAYRTELEAWWRTQRAIIDAPAATDSHPLETAPLPEPSPVLRGTWRPGRLATAALAAAGAIAVAMTALVMGRPMDAPPAPASTPRLTLLPIPFDQQGGDPGLAALLHERVVRELGKHPGVEALAPSRVSRGLRLMRRDPSAPLDASTGRDLALRDGQVGLLLTGSIHQAGAQVFLDIAAVDPADGRVRLSVEWQGASADAVLAQIRKESPRLANQLAGQAAAPAPPLEPATTASLAALRLYTAAVHAGRRRQWGAAEALARRALAADDHFAAAYAWTGWAMRQQGRPAKKCLPLLRRASELGTDVTDRESYFIAGALHTIEGDLPLAVAAFEALSRLQPGNREALDLLIDAYTRSGRVTAAVALSEVRAAQAPDDFYANVRAAHALAITRGDSARGQVFLERAQALLSSDAIDDRPFWSAWLAVFPVFQHWLAGDRTAALAALAPIDGTLARRLGHERDAFATAVGFAYLALGLGEKADAVFRYATTPARQLNLAMLALTRGDEAQARQWLSEVTEFSHVRPALFARAGLHREAEEGLDRAPIGERSAGVAAVTRGLIAEQRGRHRRARAALGKGLELLRFSGEPEYFLAIEALARLAPASADDVRMQLRNEADASGAHTYGPSQWTAGYWAKLKTEPVR